MGTVSSSSTAAAWWVSTRNRAAATDALRRCAELLAGAGGPAETAYWYGERDHAVAVARRIVRELDPDGVTDRLVA